jgi:GDSL-like Lipase/Acylhydrolase family
VARRRTAATLISGLATLLAIEGGFRVRSWLTPTPRWIAEDHYPENPRGYFRDCGDGTFCPITDRAPVHGCDAPVDPAKGQILFVGDSFTFGQGVNPADAWPSRIDFPGRQRRNCAVSGHSITPVHRDAVRRIEELHPDLVVYGMVLNDFGLYPPEDPAFEGVGGATMIADFMNFRTRNLDEYVRGRAHAAPVRWLLSLSETARYFYRAAVMRRVSALTREGYEEAFRGEHRAEGFRLIRDMAGRSKRFLVVLFPLFVDFSRYPFEALHRSIREELERSRIEVIDLLDTYRGRDARELTVYETDQHPNEVAHRLAAETLRERLRELGWPPFDR